MFLSLLTSIIFIPPVSLAGPFCSASGKTSHRASPAQSAYSQPLPITIPVYGLYHLWT
ncbi:phosphatidylinositol N-acetylglucosaminyltransferase subunit Y-like [Fukomys damarensis]|uniref:phosphatidylinositol N-acetylglucosaminyltransferase subunit Y-like n=1 Tax=Fukomys damarensis TaxID=885580 RepID=UPI001455D91F|nr:phosphatidylinositol N-acetylglucosaminyltransferase subunit Y-like [Fukomys damarensis]